MSIKIMTMVWDAFPASGSELLCMLAMADWANDAGGSLHPSMRAIAEKVRVSEKQARRIVQGLVASGYLRVVGNAFGGHPGATKQWSINTQKLKELVAQKEAEEMETPPTDGSPTPPTDGSPTPPTDGSPTPPTSVPDPSHPWEGTPPTHGSLTTIEPPIEPPIRESARKRTPPAQATQPPADVSPQVFADWLEVRKARRAGPVTETVLSAMRAEALAAGVSLNEALAHCCLSGWVGFKAAWFQRQTAADGGRHGSARQPVKTARQQFIEGCAAAIFDGATHV